MTMRLVANVRAVLHQEGSAQFSGPGQVFGGGGAGGAFQRQG